MALALALATLTEKDNCNRTCGNMSVPFPFGLDESCAWNSDHNIPVFDISVENGTMTIGLYRALDCYNETGSRLEGSNPNPWITVGKDGHYTLSDTRNKLIVFGCDTLALILDAPESFGKSACSGLGCCQTSIPKSLRSLNISIGSTTNYTSVRDFTSCGSAFVVDQESFNVSDYKLPVPADMNEDVFSRVVLDWVVERDLTCEEAQLNQSSYACGTNSNCSDFENGQGYRCFCEAGYTGNPYASPLSPGCQDIDECKDPRQYPCHGNCKNTPGNYTCNCPFGMTGDGKIGCPTFRLVIIAAGEVREIEAIGLLTRRCLNYNGMSRPTMREVAEQLARINKNLWSDQQNDEETQSLLNETRCDSLWTSISEMNKPESTDLLVFDIEAATISSSI
ncbi:hypothetical protein NL676_025426 [Syzygium grande]|nr:hypothetical protein NL676_025426 [Syzygium grande]